MPYYSNSRKRRQTLNRQRPFLVRSDRAFLNFALLLRGRKTAGTFLTHSVSIMMAGGSLFSSLGSGLGTMFAFGRTADGNGSPMAAGEPIEASDENWEKEREALISVGVKALMTLAKVIAGVASGSLAIMSEAANNFADILTSLMTFVALRIAHQPADDVHQYGHAKVEALAALVQTGLLFGFSVFIITEALRRLWEGGSIIEAGVLSFGVLIVSMVIDAIRWQSLRSIAKRTKSQALAAEALNFMADLGASGAALFGLFMTWLGFPRADPLAALAVASIIAYTGFQLGRQTINTLLDAAPEGLADKIRDLVSSVPGVIALGTLRLRPFGSQVLGEMDISVARTLPLEQAAKIKTNVRSALAQHYPDVSLTLSAHPVALGDETILERILLIAAKRHVAIHHVTVQEIDGRISISFDVELTASMTHGMAHEIVSRLENEIAQELGPGTEVESHIEPMMPAELSGRDAPAAKIAEIQAYLSKIALPDQAISEIHNVRVRETSAGLVVNYHCAVDPNLSVAEVHDRVDALDHGIRTDFPEISRVIGHADVLKQASP